MLFTGCVRGFHYQILQEKGNVITYTIHDAAYAISSHLPSCKFVCEKLFNIKGNVSS